MKARYDNAYCDASSLESNLYRALLVFFHPKIWARALFTRDNMSVWEQRVFWEMACSAHSNNVQRPLLAMGRLAAA